MRPEAQRKGRQPADPLDRGEGVVAGFAGQDCMWTVGILPLLLGCVSMKLFRVAFEEQNGITASFFFCCEVLFDCFPCKSTVDTLAVRKMLK